MMWQCPLCDRVTVQPDTSAEVWCLNWDHPRPELMEKQEEGE